MLNEKQTLISSCRANLYSAVIADTLDAFGYHNQVASPGIRPIDDAMVLCGFARVGIYMPIYHDDEQVNVYENEISLVDDLRENEVPVFVCNGNKRISPWGELLSTRAQYLKAAGCLTDGCVRDARQIKQMEFPVFSAGLNPADTKFRGKLMWYDVPAEFAGVRINSGDLVFADIDGVVFIPGELVGEVTAKALEKVSAETTVRQELLDGASLSEVFARHNIL